MPGLSYSLPAATCKTGSKLAQVEGSTCYNCYAKKGCYVFSNVQEVLYKRQAATRHPLWVKATCREGRRQAEARKGSG